MNLATYNNIVGVIRQYKGLSRNCLILLKKTFPSISRDVLCSILSLEYQKRMKNNFSKSVELSEKVLSLYKQGIESGEPAGIILKISEKEDISPTLIAKLVLQKYYENTPEVNICSYMKDTTLIPDMNLAYEVYLCTLFDDQYSPVVETMKSSIGQQYEIHLQRELMQLGIAFRDEDFLRKCGFDKTPDVKLEVPIAVDGFIVTWIESKALFGDEDSHQEYTDNQYTSYWNRYGPGLVIYWCGFVETIYKINEKRFIIRDCLPINNIIQINSSF